MWRVTPPGYVHEYGETRAIRIAPMVAVRRPSVYSLTQRWPQTSA